MLELRNVTKVYPNGAVALQDVSLTVSKGEFVFVVGHSGAGKTTLTKLLMCEESPTTTLTKLLMCEESPTSGALLVNNQDITRLRPKQVPFVRRSMGVVFQDFRLMPNWSVEENVAFAMIVVEAHPKQIRKRVPEVLELVGLANKRRELPGQLSGGEQQRIALARAIVNQPGILIADEPTGNLDPETSWGIMKLLLDINTLGTTLLMVTHAQQIVDALRKRVIALEGGRVARDDVRGVYGYET